jgi:acyl-CoA reductase-like NAD-dependent aldehyde dehydrogenase
MSIDTARHEKRAAEVLPRARLLVDGTWSDRATGGSVLHVNPSTGQVQAEIPMAGEREIDDAVAADDDEAVALANATDYGLYAYVRTRSLNRAHAMARRLEAGSVSVNAGAGAAGRGSVAMPFGGVKGSGYGREGGRAGVQEFLTKKNVYVGLA